MVNPTNVITLLQQEFPIDIFPPSRISLEDESLFHQIKGILNEAIDPPPVEIHIERDLYFDQGDSEGDDEQDDEPTTATESSESAAVVKSETTTTSSSNTSMSGRLVSSLSSKTTPLNYSFDTATLNSHGVTNSNSHVKIVSPTRSSSTGQLNEIDIPRSITMPSLAISHPSGRIGHLCPAHNNNNHSHPSYHNHHHHSRSNYNNHNHGHTTHHVHHQHIAHHNHHHRHHGKQQQPNGSSSSSVTTLTPNNCNSSPSAIQQQQQQLEIIRKRQYRVGLNLFNKGPPERGIQLLIQTGFIDLTVSPSLSTSTPSSGNTTCIPGGLTAGGLGNTSQRTSTTSSSSSASANGSTSSASSSGQTTSSGVSTSSSSPSTTIGNTTLPPPDVTHQELLASSVAHFLASRKGLSKQKIGEYLGNLQNPFNQLVLDFFVQEVDLSNLTIDEALRKYQTMFRFPGETQQIERLVEKFAARYVDCNPVLPRVRKEIPHPPSDSVGGDGEVVTFTCGGSNILSTSSTTSSTSSSSASSCMSSDCTSQGGSHLTKDEVFILSFAIIMLNTDLHVPNNKTRMTCAQWIKNLKGVFPGGDLSDSFLTDIYERIKCHELKTGLDHVSQVVMLQQQLLPGNTTATSQLPNLPIPDRRLVCFCRLYEVPDVNRKDRPGQHQREIFLFNDLLLVTKIVYNKNNRKSNNNNSNNSYNISSQTTINNNNSHNGSSAIASSNGVNNENKQNVLSMSNQFYSYRGSYPLLGLVVKIFETTYYPYGIKIIRRLDDKVILTFNARNSHDRNRFVLDLKESIEEMHLTEASINFLKNNNWKSLPIVPSSITSSVNLSHSSSSPLMNS